MKTRHFFQLACWGVCLLLSLTNTNAQFSLTGQVRTRSEYRDGLGTPLPTDGKAAFFTSQRTRLTFGYKWDRVTFQTAVQDVRVWGQDGSTIANADGNRLMVHEAWAEVVLANIADTTLKFRLFDNLSLKLGRQELIYDDVRLLGNLDWLQQARRFDAALLKVGHHGWQADIGLGFNQNTDAFGTNGTYYTAGVAPAYVSNSKGNLVAVPANFVPTATKGGNPTLSYNPSTNAQNQQFKSFQMLYLSRKFGQTKFSGLFFKDDFSKYRIDSIGSTATGVVYGRRYDQPGVNSRLTYGVMLNGQLGNASGFGKIAWQACYYQQSGKDRDGKNLSAYHYSVSAIFQKGKLAIGPGFDYLSGNDSYTTASTENKRFDPLYGTPHKHWGYMDYFYVGTGSPTGGIKNAYIKTKYVLTPTLFATFDVHNFALASPVKNGLDAAGGKLDAQLATEYDLILNYNLNKFTNLELGYCLLNATNSLEYTKFGTMDKYQKNNTWAYLMINIRPDFFYAKPVAIKQ